jgi:hypothetical protein
MFSKTFVFASLFVSAFSANAAIIDLGNITRDTATGLEWLDVTETYGVSYGDVQTQLGAAGSLYGWRYATEAELGALVINFGYTQSGIACGDAELVLCHLKEEPDPVVADFIATIGNTLAAHFGDPNFDTMEFIGIGQTRGWVLQQEACLSTNCLAQFFWVDETVDDPGFSFVRTNRYVPTEVNEAGERVEYDPVPSSGSFLVRTSAVPIPAAAWLFGSALLGLAGLKRRE